MPALENLALVQRLQQLDNRTPDYWTFGGRDRRVGAHALFQYPAMMVPQMQGAILDLVREVDPTANRVLDPFVGSGTTLVESMARGLDFRGVDINPLAILISRVKAAVLDPQILKESLVEITSRLASDHDLTYFVKFKSQQKWFSKSASIGLSRVARAIEREPELEVRRVFWVALARVIRMACNSRGTTYKLHLKGKEELLGDTCDIKAEFARQAAEVVSALDGHYQMLTSASVLRNGKYIGNIAVETGDLIDDDQSVTDKLADIVITSPPYGDNKTTIPYGQYSYLPLQWIPTSDICAEIAPNIIANTHATDTASLGGSMLNAVSRGDQSCGSFKSYITMMDALKDNQDAQKRFGSFASDLHKSILVLGKKTAERGFHVWTVGERRIGGHQVPMASLVKEMLASEGIIELYTASRRILSKRMASRNTSSDTMGSERIIIARKGNV